MRKKPTIFYELIDLSLVLDNRAGSSFTNNRSDKCFKTSMSTIGCMPHSATVTNRIARTMAITVLEKTFIYRLNLIIFHWVSFFYFIILIYLIDCYYDANGSTTAIQCDSIFRSAGWLFVHTYYIHVHANFQCTKLLLWTLALTEGCYIHRASVHFECPIDWALSFSRSSIWTSLMWFQLVLNPTFFLSSGFYSNVKIRWTICLRATSDIIFSINQ